MEDHGLYDSLAWRVIAGLSVAWRIVYGQSSFMAGRCVWLPLLYSVFFVAGVFFVSNTGIIL